MGKALFGVTARHVYERYLERAEAEPTICQIGNLVVNLKERLIGTGPIAIHMNTPMGLTCWFLSAVISEGHQEYDIIHGVRADRINDDGTICG
jgi:hypothetical protein